MPTLVPQLFVHPEGNDSNDGRSWWTAKRTILSAYDAIGAGEIHIADGSSVGGEVENQGIWITNDAALRGPGTGWRPHKHVHFIGIGQSVAQFGNAAAAIIGGNKAKPSIWLSGVLSPMRFDNLLLPSHIQIGIGPNRTQDESTMVAMARFQNIQVLNFFDGNLDSIRPALTIGNAFWLWFEHCRFLAHAGLTNERAEALQTPEVLPGSDQRAVILIKPARGANAGLLHFENLITGAGNLKFYGSENGGGLSVRNAIFESDGKLRIGSPVHIQEVNPWVQIELRHLSGADLPDAQPDVRIDGPAVPDSILVERVPSVVGPCTIISAPSSVFSQQLESTPAAQGQVGFWGGRVVAQHDSARRSFAPVAVRFRNLAPQDVSVWSRLPQQGNLRVTPNVRAPDGTMGACRLEELAGAVGMLELYRVPASFETGDFLFIGCWARKERQAPRTGFDGALSLGFANGSLGVFPAFPIKGDGEWQWISGYARVPPTLQPTELVFGLRCDYSLAADFYAPMFLHVPHDQLSANEAAEFAQHFSTWPSGTEPGCVTTQRGQKLLAQGGIGVGNHAPVQGTTALGSVVRKVEIFDEAGRSLGFIPVYDAIT
jgi:hypothetical protein